MKKLSCSAMGGGDKCKEVFEGETADELLAKADKHIRESDFHLDLQEEMKKTTPEEKEKWMKFYNKLWKDTLEV